MNQDIRYWKLGTTEGDHGPSRFDSMKDGNFMAIGYGLGNLSDITNDEKGKNLLMKRIRNRHRDPSFNLDKEQNEIFRFLFGLFAVSCG